MPATSNFPFVLRVLDPTDLGRAVKIPRLIKRYELAASHVWMAPAWQEILACSTEVEAWPLLSDSISKTAEVVMASSRVAA